MSASTIPDLDETERAFLATVQATLRAPGMSEFRRRLRAGELALVVEDGEIVFLTPEAVALALRSRLLRREQGGPR